MKIFKTNLESIFFALQKEADRLQKFIDEQDRYINKINNDIVDLTTELETYVEDRELAKKLLSTLSKYAKYEKIWEN